MTLLVFLAECSVIGPIKSMPALVGFGKIIGSADDFGHKTCSKPHVARVASGVQMHAVSDIARKKQLNLQILPRSLHLSGFLNHLWRFHALLRHFAVHARHLVNHALRL